MKTLLIIALFATLVQTVSADDSFSVGSTYNYHPVTDGVRDLDKFRYGIVVKTYQGAEGTVIVVRPNNGEPDFEVTL